MIDRRFDLKAHWNELYRSIVYRNSGGMSAKYPTITLTALTKRRWGSEAQPSFLGTSMCGACGCHAIIIREKLERLSIGNRLMGRPAIRSSLALQKRMAGTDLIYFKLGWRNISRILFNSSNLMERLIRRTRPLDESFPPIKKSI